MNSSHELLKRQLLGGQKVYGVHPEQLPSLFSAVRGAEMRLEIAPSLCGRFTHVRDVFEDCEGRIHLWSFTGPMDTKRSYVAQAFRTV